ncbi:MAG TPA: hypothetical protein VGF82_30035 [Terracidiphilus sp.]
MKSLSHSRWIVRFALPVTALLGIGVTRCSGCAPSTGSAAAMSSTSTAGAARTPNTTFQDPLEQAFTVEVPQGWKVRGGLFRLGYSDERPMVDLFSPDGQTNVRLGDVSIPTYTTPAPPYHTQEGSVVDLGAQAQLTVAKYRTGPEFAVLYSHTRFYQDCKSPTADSSDLGFTIPDYIPSQGGPAPTSSAGAIAYQCGTGTNERVAFAYAKTQQAGALWGAPALGSFLSPPSQVATAKAVLLHCAQTFKLNPAWIEKQKQLDAYALQYQQARQQQRRIQIGQQVQQFEAQMQAMRNQVASFESHQQAFANQVQGFDNALSGVTPTIDPFTGQAKDVWTGPTSNYWENGAGDVVNSANASQGNWSQMPVAHQ